MNHLSPRELLETLSRLTADRDRVGAVRAATRAVRDGALTVDELYQDVLAPWLIGTGAAWQHGEEHVWEEHFASATVRTIVESLFLYVADKAAEIAPNGRTVVLAAPPGEQHDLGLRMLADRLTLRGWKVCFLGADTPVAEIAAAAGAMGADLVAVSAATHYSRALLREEIDELKRLLPGVRVGVGGPAFANDRCWPADELISEAELGLEPHSTGDGS